MPAPTGLMRRAADAAPREAKLVPNSERGLVAMGTDFGGALSYRFVPPGVPANFLNRPRLDERLFALFENHRAVEVVAGAGSGKSVMAQLFASQIGHPFGWLTANSGDTSPARLLSAIARVLESVSEGGSEVLDAALRSGCTPEEAAATFAETLRPQRFLLVVDECQHLAPSSGAISALATFLAYAPSTFRMLLLSRVPLGGAVCRSVLEGTTGRLGDNDLKLTAAESADYLRLEGVEDDRALEIFQASGGWVAGVVFGLRIGWPKSGTSAELFQFLGSEILASLPEDEQQFLIETSVPDAVTAELTTSLLGETGPSLWERVRSRELPATTTTENSIVYHPMLRSFLRNRLTTTAPGRESILKRNLALHLMRHQLLEEATDVFLSIPDVESAVSSAKLALRTVYQRADWKVLRAWLEEFGDQRVLTDPILLGAQIRTLHGTNRFDEAVALVRSADRDGKLELVIEEDPGVLAVVALVLEATPLDALAYLDRYRGDHRAKAVRFMFEATTGQTPAVPPVGTKWDDVERLMVWGLLWQGRIADVLAMVPDALDLPVNNSNLIFAYLARGDVTTARSILNRVPPEIRLQAHTKHIEGAIFLAEGKFSMALDCVQSAIDDSRRTGSALETLYEVTAGQVMVALGRVDDGTRLLEQRVVTLTELRQAAILEWAQTHLGLAYLRVGRDEEALQLLRECVASMAAAGRKLFLPAAAVYLAEAEARAGRDEAARELAEYAYEVSVSTATFFPMIEAMRSVPAVLQRELKRPSPDPRWKRLVVSKAGRASSRLSVGETSTSVFVQTLGPDRDIIVNGTPARIGRLKVVELACLILLQPQGIERFELQRRLFPDADQRRGGNHFRQVAHKFREATGIRLDRSATNIITIPQTATLDSTDLQFERLIASAQSLIGEERLAVLRKALALAEGTYLEGSDLSWAEDRRFYLDVVREDALLETARLCLDLERMGDVRTYAEQLLSANPFSEQAYGLLLQSERTTGSEASRQAVYRRASTALTEIGYKPEEVRELLDRHA